MHQNISVPQQIEEALLSLFFCLLLLFLFLFVFLLCLLLFLLILRPSLLLRFLSPFTLIQALISAEQLHIESLCIAADANAKESPGPVERSPIADAIRPLSLNMQRERQHGCDSEENSQSHYYPQRQHYLTT